MSTWVEDVEARIARYASDEGMPQAEWEAMGARIVMDAMRLLAVAKAAERIVAETDTAEPLAEEGVDHIPRHLYCGGDPYIPSHHPDCRWQALVSALREGE